MKLLVNGDSRDFAEGATVAALMDTLGIDPSFIAVSVNQTFVPRSTYTTRALHEGDEIEILSPRQGG